METNTWYRLHFEASGQTLAAYIDGDLLYVVTDAIFDTGKIELLATPGGIVQFDNITVTSLEDMGDSDSVGGEAPDTPFPMTDDANILLQDSESATYGTSLSIDETVEFYRTEFDKLGFTERTLLTNVLNDSFSMVFDGHSSGMAIVVQGTDFGDSINISISLTEL